MKVLGRSVCCRGHGAVLKGCTWRLMRSAGLEEGDGVTLGSLGMEFGRYGGAYAIWESCRKD